jgi:transposase
VILEVLRGADLESTSRKHRATIATLTEGRDRFLAGGEAGLKSRKVEPLEVRRRQYQRRKRTAARETAAFRLQIRYGFAEGTAASRLLMS